MRILITNDDGIHAPGLEVAHRIAAAVAGGAHNVWTVAPMAENSGVGHAISYVRPVRFEEMGPQSFAVDGTPADCVLVGLTHIMKDAPPDLVISGVNRGNNIAENTLYSGTVGASIEAVLQGVRTIALSQFLGPQNASAENPFEAADVHGAQVVSQLAQNAPWNDRPYPVFYNVNFPPMLAAGVKGVKATTQGRRPKETAFRAEPHVAPNRRTYYWLTGGLQQVTSEPGSDAHENLQGYISVTPCRADLTAHELVADLPKISL